MNFPSVSIVTCTYGRTKFLPQAVAMFLDQDYAGELELILLNSFPNQKISCNAKNVRTINLDVRPASLGECRNEAIKQAKGEILIGFDDDDAMLPHHVSSLAKHFKTSVEWVWISSQFFSEKKEIKKVMPGNISSLAYTRAAWEKIGGFDPLTVGEDRSFIGKLSSQCNGTVVRVEPHEITFIYGWNNFSPHISGLGTDDRRSPSSHVWAQEELESRIKSGEEPTGNISISPNMTVDWVAKTNEFVKTNYGTLKTLKNEVCIVLLGGLGEIVNCLPISKHINDNFKTPFWMVSEEFKSIFDGVSYVKTVPVKLNKNDLDKALEIARKEFKFVLCAQVIGKNFLQVQNTAAYNIESWRNCGFEYKFTDKTWMPLFDNLDTNQKHVESGLILISDTLWDFGVCATRCGQKQTVTSDWRGSISHWLSKLNAASALVSNESDLIHLAAASNVPVVAIVESHPWFTIEPRCNVVAKLTREQITKSPEDLIISIKAAIASSFPPVHVSPAVVAPVRKIFHCVDIRDTSKLKDKDRIHAAQYSWESMYHQGVIPAHYTDKKRTADKTIGDSRALPYLKDVLENAMVKMDAADILVWTNDDVWIHPQLPDMIRFHVSVYGPCSSSRREFMNGFPEPFNHTPEQISKMGTAHVGRDLFAATKEWLVAHWDEIPDAVLGCTLFDLQLGHICRIDKNQRFDQGTLEQVVWPSEIPAGYVAHAHHFPAWANDPNDSPGQRHNKTIYDKFWAENKHKLEPV